MVSVWQNKFHNNEILHAGLQQFSHGISNALFSEFIQILQEEIHILITESNGSVQE